MILRRTLPAVFLTPVPAALAQRRGGNSPAADATPAAAPAPADYRWRVMRNGTEIGSHTVTFTARGDELVALSDVTITPRVLGVVVFRFEHRYTEVTRGTRLVSLRSRQNRNGTVVEVSAEGGAGGVSVRGPDGVLALPVDAVPLSWWQPQRFGAVPIFGSTTGRLMDLRWTRGTLPGGGTSWRCEGEVDAMLEYSAAGRWVAYSVRGDDGSTVSYTAA